MPKVLKTVREVNDAIKSANTLTTLSPEVQEAPESPKSYVVFYLESTSQGTRSGSRIVNGYNNALDYCKELKGGFCGSTLEVRLFELGKEIALETLTSTERVKK
jgi:hypothetical protein